MVDGLSVADCQVISSSISLMKMKIGGFTEIVLNKKVNRYRVKI